MKKILIITGRYLPGYKDGGPVRTIKNLTDLLGDDYHFTVMCSDRDHGDIKPYENINEGLNRVGKADVIYVPNSKFSFSLIKSEADKNDLIYVCGPYNSYAIKALLLNRLSLIKCPFVLAPMGSFSKGALNIKSMKKRVFFTIVKLLNLFKNVSFSVTSSIEEQELSNALKLNNRCFIARDPERTIDESISHNEFKKNEKLNVVFLSRISEKKNLIGAIDILSNVKGNIDFKVYGNIEDKDYYDKCIKKLTILPANVSFEYMGTANSEDVPKILSEYDVFLFPTHGENFGHVISEALLAGTIPVISDTTPWLDLDKENAGFVINSGDTASFAKTIDKLYQMSREELLSISNNARAYYKKHYVESVNNNGYRAMYEELLR